MSGIGILNEGPLHASIKSSLAKPGDTFEVSVNGYFIDIVRDSQLIEIQTRNFSAIRKKLKNLLPFFDIHLVYPIAIEKWIVKNPLDVKKYSRRKSPKRGCVEELFLELVSIPDLIGNPRFSLEVLLIREEEVRYHDAEKNWRRRGWTTQERRLVEIIDSKLLTHASDFLCFIPVSLREMFCSEDLAIALNINKQLAQKIVYCLCIAKVIRLVGKRGRYKLYTAQ